MMRRLPRMQRFPAALFLLLVAALSACGVKGPLTLPKQNGVDPTGKPAQSSTQPQVPSASTSPSKP